MTTAFNVLMRHAFLLLASALALPACSVLPQATGGSTAASNPGDHRSTTPTRTPRINSGAPIARQGAEGMCLAQLGESGVRFEALPDRYLDQGCSNLNTVVVHALASDQGQLGVTNIGPVTCPVSAAFAAWARYGVDRAARQIYGQPLASIQTMGSYSCRNVAGSNRRSAHATAAAIDIGGFVLADGTRISVKDGWHGSAREREFLRTIQRSACRRFNTVLGPDYNADHEDHFHVEGVIEGNSYCR